MMVRLVRVVDFSPGVVRRLKAMASSSSKSQASGRRRTDSKSSRM